MGIFDWWPYTNLHSLNTDWLVHIVHKFINESKVIFEDQEEQIKWLKDNFEALKIYVEEYFESLDVKEEITEVMDKWLEDGTIESLIEGPIVMFNKFYKQNYDGNLILRQRRNRIENSATSNVWTVQNGAIYSPTGEYSLDNQDMRLYIWNTTSNDDIAQFKTYDMNNNEVNSFNVSGMKHGGPIVFKDNKAYSMNFSRFLTVFNLQDPSAPTVESQRTLSLQSNYLIGVMDDYFIGIKQDTTNRKLTLYKITSDFNTELVMFELEGGITGLFQDAVVDNKNGLVYWLSFEPNVIHIHSLIDGTQISQIKIPETIGYVSVGEAEFIDIKDDMLILGSFQPVGTGGDNKIDIKVWASTPETLGNNSRQYVLNQAGTRAIYVDYQTADGRNPNVSRLGNTLIFKYIEDAQNCVKAMNRGAEIRVREAYNDGWQLYVDTVVSFGDNTSRAFNIDQNVNASINNVAFSGNPMTQDGIKCFINQREGSKVIYNNINNLELNGADVILHAEKSEVTIVNASNLVRNISLYASILNSIAGIGENFYSYNSILNVDHIDCSKYATQYISASSQLNMTKVYNGTNQRPSIGDICSGNMRLPQQFIVFPRTASRFNYRPIENLWGIKASNGASPITSGYYDNPTSQYVTYTYKVNRETIQVPLPNYPGTYYRYWLSDVSMSTDYAGTLCVIQTL